MTKDTTKKVIECDHSFFLKSHYCNHEVIISVDEIEMFPWNRKFM